MNYKTSARFLRNAIIVIIFSLCVSSTQPSLAVAKNEHSDYIKQPNVESSTTPEVIPRLLPNIENGSHKEVSRQNEINWNGKKKIDGTTEAESFTTLSETVSLSTTAAETFGPNLVKNAGVENATASGLPTSWFKGGYGTNNRVLIYPVSGVGGGKALQVSITSYTDGDVKWYSDEVPVTPGKIYRFSDDVRSTSKSTVTLRYTKTDGTLKYIQILETPPSSVFTHVETSFTVPSGVVSLSIFHAIKSTGTLTTDNYAIQEVIPASGDEENLLPNPNFEQSSTGGLPLSWIKGGYGTNNRVLSYPVTGVDGTKAVQVSITTYTSGDAKWVHAPVEVSGGLYTYTDAYKSTTSSIVTVEFQKTDGTLAYLDAAVLPSSPNAFSQATVDFSVPINVSKVRIFHLIKSVGTLTIDQTGLFKKPNSGTVFDTGAISLTFDDGWKSHHDIAMKKLNEVGLKGTFYIISHQLNEDGFVGFVSKDQVREIRASGHEIGAHTQTHKALTTLTPTQQKSEIEGSKSDLENMGVGPITTFAYPFGDYNEGVLTLVKNASYEAARATIGGNVTPNSDIYQLPRFSVENQTTLVNVKSAIDTAIANRQWIILVFHNINTSSEQYDVTPEKFNAIIDYVHSKNAPVTTVAEGIKKL